MSKKSSKGISEYSLHSESVGANENEEESTYQPDVVQLPRSSSYNSDTQRSDTTTICSGSMQEDIDTEKFSSENYDQKCFALSRTIQGSLSDNVSLPSTFETVVEKCSEYSAPVDRSTLYDMNPPFNRSSHTSQDGVAFASMSGTNDSSSKLYRRSDVVEEGRIEVSNDKFNRAFRNEDNTSVHSSSANSKSPAVPLTAAYTSTLLTYYDHAKSPAPSSVKSFGSNVGSDDCGGSLDVETHSVDARSIDETLPVVMPEQDPETAAVASLSIIESTGGAVRLTDGNQLRLSQHVFNEPLTLQRFHQRDVKMERFDSESDEKVESIVDQETEQLPPQIIGRRDIGTDEIHRVPSVWNDPRIDTSAASRPSTTRQARRKYNEKQAPGQPTTRSRSRSRSPARDS